MHAPDQRKRRLACVLRPRIRVMEIRIWPQSWAEVLLPHAPLAELVVRAALVYFFLLTVLRVLGRREIGRISLSDILVMILLATAVRRALVGGYASVGDGLILVVLLVLYDWCVRQLTVRFPGFRRLVRPPPIPLIRDGRVLEANLERELLSRDELLAQLRLAGIDSVEEVAEAYLEPEGKISAIRRHTDAHDQRRSGEGATRDATRS